LKIINLLLQGNALTQKPKPKSEKKKIIVCFVEFLLKSVGIQTTKSDSQRQI